MRHSRNAAPTRIRIQEWIIPVAIILYIHPSLRPLTFPPRQCPRRKREWQTWRALDALTDNMTNPQRPGKLPITFKIYIVDTSYLFKRQVSQLGCEISKWKYMLNISVWRSTLRERRHDTQRSVWKITDKIHTHGNHGFLRPEPKSQLNTNLNGGPWSSLGGGLLGFLEVIGVLLCKRLVKHRCIESSFIVCEEKGRRKCKA